MVSYRVLFVGCYAAVTWQAGKFFSTAISHKQSQIDETKHITIEIGSRRLPIINWRYRRGSCRWLLLLRMAALENRSSALHAAAREFGPVENGLQGRETHRHAQDLDLVVGRHLECRTGSTKMERSLMNGVEIEEEKEGKMDWVSSWRLQVGRKGVLMVEGKKERGTGSKGQGAGKFWRQRELAGCCRGSSRGKSGSLPF